MYIAEYFYNPRFSARRWSYFTCVHRTEKSRLSSPQYPRSDLQQSLPNFFLEHIFFFVSCTFALIRIRPECQETKSLDSYIFDRRVFMSPHSIHKPANAERLDCTCSSHICPHTFTCKLREGEPCCLKKRMSHQTYPGPDYQYSQKNYSQVCRTGVIPLPFSAHLRFSAAGVIMAPDILDSCPTPVRACCPDLNARSPHGRAVGSNLIASAEEKEKLTSVVAINSRVRGNRRRNYEPPVCPRPPQKKRNDDE